MERDYNGNFKISTKDKIYIGIIFSIIALLITFNIYFYCKFIYEKLII
jgi:hypothetical protein